MFDVPRPLAQASFPIVAIGASAGGLEAFTQLLRRLPPDTGLAFVLIQHLDRTHPSLLSEALQKATAMPVSQAEHDMRVEPDHVYAIAPNTDLAIRNGTLFVTPRAADGSTSHLPVDFFMQSLAAELGGHAIGVILSGAASDGTEGLRAIKAHDGITLAQSPTSARFASMPQSANDAGVVDYCLDIPELADELVRLSRHPYVRLGQPQAHVADDALRNEIFAIVRDAVGLDFSEFKSATIERRLARRLALRGAADLKAYRALLIAEPEEVRALYEDMLIHVTEFFRDPEVFAALRDSVLPEIFKSKAAGAAVRIWAAGCSTGEEAYSLAIMSLELSNGYPDAHPIQIFGSDVSEVAIRKARAGFYGEGALRNVSEEQLRRYFTKAEGGYRIAKSVRERCVFVRHDFARDPPFSKIDLVSCRNVLIYFDQALQKKVVPLLHYALNQPGYLVLGRSESITAFSHLFSAIDNDSKIFSRTSVASGMRFAPRTSLDPLIARLPDYVRSSVSGDGARFARHLDQLLLARYSPPGVLINADLDVLLFRGPTGAFLQAAPGQPQHNLLNMARDGLIGALRATIEQAKQEMVVVRRRDVEVSQDGAQSSRCDIVVIPFSGIPGNDQALFIVLFEQTGGATSEDEQIAHPPAFAPGTADDRRNARLEHELAATKEYLHTLVEEHSRANDALGASNEELISGNEELQSMNEELETAKEELQSINEELTTLNDELRARNKEVERLVGEAETARAEAVSARTEAERSNNAKDDFLATLSHELRTPLSIMLLQSQRLRAGTLGDPESLKRAGESLERATWTQVNLIDDLLDVSRIITGKLTVDLRRVDLGGAVRMALDAMSPLLEAKALALTLSVDPNIDPIWADAARAQQIVTNLLNNAIKFTPAGGHVTVTVDSVDGFARVRVADTGIGIAPGFLPHVFARFSQSDTSITRKYGGLGLGLALVRHLVELQGGTVAVESAGVDQGASFLVSFPLAAIKAGTVAAAKPQETQTLDRPGKTRHYDALKNLRVLFIDDDDATREAVREVLLYTGAQVEVAACAADGVTAVAAFKPQVILCDIAMPEEDGYSFIRKQRAREKALGPSQPRIPALALTALASDEDKQRATAAGFQLHLAKPIDIDRLRDSVLALSKLVTPPHGAIDVV